MRFSFCLILLMLGFIACDEDKAIPPAKSQPSPLQDTALIFGTYYGFCFPPDSCVHIYKLADGRVYKDTTHHYPHDTSSYRFLAIDTPHYQKVRELKKAFPRRLITDTATKLGCPDCRDQGGYYVALKTDKYEKRWLIDTDLDAVSPFLRPFLRKVDSAMHQLP